MRTAGLRVLLGSGVAAVGLLGAGVLWPGRDAVAGPYAFTLRGTPVAWLDRYGLPTDTEDDDGDGRRTWEEYIIGANPTNADDFAIGWVSVPNSDTMIVHWLSSTNGSPEPYLVRFATNVATGRSHWPVLGVSPRNPPANTWTGACPSARGFLSIEATYPYLPEVTLDIRGASLTEPAGTAYLTAALSAPYYLPVLVQLGFSGAAEYAEDYQTSQTAIYIPAGDANATITLDVLDDDLPEDVEDAQVSITDVSNAREVGEQQVKAVIASEDPLPPRILVIKDADPDDPQVFAFDGGLGYFLLDDDPESATPHARWFGPLTPGQYKISEEEMQGWSLTGIETTDPDDSSWVDLQSRMAVADLDAGETVVVRFRNTKLGSIEVIKNAAPDDPKDFTFSGTLGAFALDDDGNPGLPNSRFFGDLAPATYVIAEDPVAGWRLAGIAVQDPDGGSTTNLGARRAFLDLDPGEHITVVFENVWSNQPPAAVAGGPYEIAEGDSLVLDGSWSADPDSPWGDLIVLYEWDLDDDGTFETTAVPDDNPFATLSWAELGAFGIDDGPSTRIVGLRVTDSHGLRGTNTATLAVTNLPPAVTNLSLTPRVDEGSASILAGALVDPGNDTFFLHLDWGDGSTQDIDLSAPTPGVTFDPVTRAFTVEHSFRDDGPSPGNLTVWDLSVLSGTVADDDGGSCALVDGGQGPVLANDVNASGFSVTQQILVGMPIGQTFAAISDNRLATVACWIADMNASVAPDDFEIDVALYEGEGDGGRLLGRRTFDGLTDGFDGFVSLDFSSVTLREGQTYTIVVENDTARWGRVACGNQYAGGTAWYAGVASPGFDGLFRVTWQPDGAAPQLGIEVNASGWSMTQQIQVGMPIGQTFAAVSDNRLATIDCWIADMNATVAPDDFSIDVALYEGEGDGGRLLGRRTFDGLTDEFSGFVSLDFSSITLREGQTYTVVIENDTARWGRLVCGNQYAGGTAWYAGVANPTADTLFRVTWQPDGATPQLGIEVNASGWSMTQQIQVGMPIGQTFAAVSDNRLATIACWIADMNAAVAPDDFSIDVALYEGEGDGGRLLGRRTFDGLTDGFGGFASVDFSSVTLREGQTYTIVLENDTPRWGRVVCGNQYAGGTAWYAGAATPTADALFRVTWQPDGTAPQLGIEVNASGFSVTQQIQVGMPIGQTFAAISDNRLATVACWIADMNASVAPDDFEIDVALYEGEGDGGRLLGRRTFDGLTDGFDGFVSLDFSSVTLREGQTYTIVVENDTARWGRVACGNQYAGGTAWYAGVASPGFDGLFRVTWQPDGAAPQLGIEVNASGWSMTQQIQVGMPIGQTFAAVSDNRLSTIDCWIADMNAAVAPNDFEVDFALYEGEGDGGRLLGRRTFNGLTDGFGGFASVDFSSITLRKGHTYTIVLDNDTPRWGRVVCGNQYAGGTAWYAGAATATADALFRVTWQPDAGQLGTFVDNVPPSFDAGPDETLPLGRVGALDRKIEFSDPGYDDVHTVRVDYGDGTGAETSVLAVGDRTFIIKHEYTQQGTFTVQVTISDDDLGVQTDSFSITH